MFRPVIEPQKPHAIGYLPEGQQNAFLETIHHNGFLTKWIHCRPPSIDLANKKSNGYARVAVVESDPLLTGLRDCNYFQFFVRIVVADPNGVGIHWGDEDNKVARANINIE
jgi:hypothetical protein